MLCVREGGFEPPRPFGHWHLKPARLPFRHSRAVRLFRWCYRFSRFAFLKNREINSSVKRPKIPNGGINPLVAAGGGGWEGLSRRPPPPSSLFPEVRFTTLRHRRAF